MTDAAAVLSAGGPVADRIEPELERLGYATIWRLDSATDWRLAGLDLLVSDLQALVPQPWRGIRAIRQRLPEGCLVVVVPARLATQGAALLAAGADAVVTDTELERTLAPAVRAARRGQVVAPYEAIHMSPPVALSPGQQVLLSDILGGRTNAQIAARAGLAESTVKGHVSTLFKKLGVRSRSEVPGVVGSVIAQAAPHRLVSSSSRRPLSPSAER